MYITREIEGKILALFTGDDVLLREANRADSKHLFNLVKD